MIWHIKRQTAEGTPSLCDLPELWEAVQEQHEGLPPLSSSHIVEAKSRLLVGRTDRQTERGECDACNQHSCDSTQRSEVLNVAWSSVLIMKTRNATHLCMPHYGTPCWGQNSRSAGAAAEVLTSQGQISQQAFDCNQSGHILPISTSSTISLFCSSSDRKAQPVSF